MAKYNFLEAYIADVLKENGFDDLSEENQKVFLPQFTSEAERRIGAALTPLLTKESAQIFIELAQKDATPEEWAKFWTENVSDFDGVIKRTLDGYASEIRLALSEK